MSIQRDASRSVQLNALGLEPGEIQHLIQCLVGPTTITGEVGSDYRPAAEVASQRRACEAAAALIAANNRRLTEQLRQLGLLPA